MIFKKLTTLTTTLGLALALGSTTTAAVFEDFEGYATGDLQVVGAPTWTVENAGDSTIVDDGGNQYLTYGGTDDWRHNYRETGAPIGTTGTFSFRVYAEAEATDHAFGLVGALDGGALDWYGDYGPYVRVTDDGDGANGTVSVDVRDGGGFVNDIATLNVGEWYDVLLDISTAGGGSFDVYVEGALAYSNAGFRRAYAAPLDHVLLMGGNGFGQTVRIDDLNVVPEPCALALLAGAACVPVRRRRGR